MNTMRLLRRLIPGLCTILLASGCTVGSGNSTPTATTAPQNAIPTVIATTAPASPPAGLSVLIRPTPTAEASFVPRNTDMSGIVITTQPMGTSASSPMAIEEPPPAGPATPIAINGAAPGPVPTNPPSVAAAGVASADGTGGATIATPTAGVAASPTTVIVEGCTVANVPPYTGSNDTPSTLNDVNYRVGPSVDCDLVAAVPVIGAFQTVQIIGGPVRDADGTEWMQVQVNATTGWVAAEFLDLEN